MIRRALRVRHAIDDAVRQPVDPAAVAPRDVHRRAPRHPRTAQPFRRRPLHRRRRGADGVLLATGNQTAGGNEMWRPGGPDFVDGSDADFIFAAMDAQDSKARHIYAATMQYSS